MNRDPHEHMGDSYGRMDPEGAMDGCLTMILIGIGGTVIVGIVKWLLPILFQNGMHF